VFTYVTLVILTARERNFDEFKSARTIRNTQIIYSNSVRTSQETHYVSATYRNQNLKYVNGRAIMVWSDLGLTQTYLIFVLIKSLQFILGLPRDYLPPKFGIRILDFYISYLPDQSDKGVHSFPQSPQKNGGTSHEISRRLLLSTFFSICLLLILT
jgi:hypothetical protein